MEKHNTFLHISSTFFIEWLVWHYDPAGYYQSNFVNGKDFTRRPRYCLVFKVNIESFTRPHRKDF